MKRRLLPQTRVRRIVAALATAAALTGVTAGCQVASPIQTDVHYLPADGISADIGKVALRDLVVVVDGSGTAMVSGAAVNDGSDQVTLQFAPQQESGAGAGVEVQLAPGEQLNLAEKGVQLSGVSAKPGTNLNVSVTSSAAGTQLLTVPALPATGYYATVTPGPTAS